MIDNTVVEPFKVRYHLVQSEWIVLLNYLGPGGGIQMFMDGTSHCLHTCGYDRIILRKGNIDMNTL